MKKLKIDANGLIEALKIIFMYAFSVYTATAILFALSPGNKLNFTLAVVHSTLFGFLWWSMEELLN